MSDETRRLLASRKTHMGVVTRKGNEFDKIKTKPIEEITADDRLLAETLLESLTEKIAKIGEINLKVLDATETSDEALETEIFKQDGIETEEKSLMMIRLMRMRWLLVSWELTQKVVTSFGCIYSPKNWILKLLVSGS